MVVGCQPGTLEDGIGLSESVAAAVGPAAAMVRDVVLKELARPPVAAGRREVARGGG
jgi:hydrogenase maturation protease